MSIESEQAWADDVRRQHMDLIKTKTAAGEQLTREDWVALAAEGATAMEKRVFAAMVDRADRAAFRHALKVMITEISALSVVHAEKRAALEGRISVLEARLAPASAEPAPLRVVGGES